MTTPLLQLLRFAFIWCDFWLCSGVQHWHLGEKGGGGWPSNLLIVLFLGFLKQPIKFCLFDWKKETGNELESHSLHKHASFYYYYFFIINVFLNIFLIPSQLLMFLGKKKETASNRIVWTVWDLVLPGTENVLKSMMAEKVLDGDEEKNRSVHRFMI